MITPSICSPAMWSFARPMCCMRGRILRDACAELWFPGCGRHPCPWQIPTLARLQVDPCPVQTKSDVIVCLDRDMQASRPFLGGEVEVSVFLDPGSCGQPHESGRQQRTMKRPQDLGKVPGPRQEGSIGKFYTGWIRIDHQDRMQRGCRPSKRDDTPIAVIVLFDEVVDPIVCLKEF